MTLLHLFISALAIGIGAYLIPGIEITIIGALVLAIVLAVINIFLKPIIGLLTLPINIVTLGLFSLVVNALLIMFAGVIVPDFVVAGFWSAFFFSIVVSLVTALFGSLKRD
ncbi:phage holin family protein [Patescibacteria group bacterium]|nr:phage holin family protein [Patescibacteria group bacterium]MBU1500864.1 phage holin family protein [Patescibacteria group bacterium]MBU2080919.1 phage holin family protein [Patescibacteria group bacterium]MBU2124024.1 phage holin family protein [Patescibacteria group bacterium]MBU2194685.1 phage holin family protein [Patescibacteria group bacterium]